MTRSSGCILPSRACTSPWMPSSRESENPQMSASSTPTVRPLWASATARLAVSVDLPTPPLPEAIISTGAWKGMDVRGDRSWARARARRMSSERAPASSTPMTRSTLVIDSRASTASRTSRSIWVLKGQPVIVRSTCTTAWPVSLTEISPTMPSSTMDAPSSGSRTWLRRSRRSAALVTGSRYRSFMGGVQSQIPSLPWKQQTIEGVPCRVKRRV